MTPLQPSLVCAAPSPRIDQSLGRIMSTLLRCMFPLSGVKLLVSRWNTASGDPENGMKRSHRVEPTVETEHIFVEIGLEMFWFDTAMMRSFDPRLHIAEDEMDHGKVRFCLVGVASECQRFMAISGPVADCVGNC